MRYPRDRASPTLRQCCATAAGSSVAYEATAEVKRRPIGGRRCSSTTKCVERIGASEAASSRGIAATACDATREQRARKLAVPPCWIIQKSTKTVKQMVDRMKDIIVECRSSSSLEYRPEVAAVNSNRGRSSDKGFGLL